MNARLPWTASRRRAPCGWVLGQVFPRVHTLVRGQQWGKLERMCTAACIGRMRRMDAASRAALAAAEAEAVRAQAEGVADGGAAEAADGTWDLERHFDGMTVRRARVYGIDLLKDFEASEEQDDTVSEAASTAPPPHRCRAYRPHPRAVPVLRAVVPGGHVRWSTWRSPSCSTWSTPTTRQRASTTREWRSTCGSSTPRESLGAYLPLPARRRQCTYA